MLNVTIQNDGKIKIQTECSDVKDKLVLVASNPVKKLHAVKEIREILHIGLKEAKDLVDECIGDKMAVLSKGTKSEMATLSGKFNPSIVQVKVIDDKEWL